MLGDVSTVIGVVAEMTVTLVYLLLLLVASSEGSVRNSRSVEESCYSKDSPYSGDLSKTVTGKLCQPWTDDLPQAHTYHDDSMFPDGSQENANAYCRSPDGEHWPWCYTTDPDTRWEYCAVQGCDTDCYEDGGEYSGFVAHTLSGRTCQPWTSDAPHEHGFHNDSKYPDGSQEAAENYCRNPENDFYPPWCYTTDPNMRWQYCDVKNCDESASDANFCGQCFSENSSYTGFVAETVRGFTCQMWKSNSPHVHNYHDGAMFPEGDEELAYKFCRDPDGTGWPWCYTTNPEARWDYCYVETCEDDCFDGESQYDGPLKHTLGGYECQAWTSDVPHRHNFHSDTQFPDGSQSLAENYCRSPDGWWPWCYTTDPNVRWDYCPVEGCNGLE